MYTTNLKIMPRIADLVNACKSSGARTLVEGGFLRELLLPDEEEPENHFRNLFTMIATYRSQEEQAKLFEAVLIRYAGASSVVGSTFDAWCTEARDMPHGRGIVLSMVIPMLIAHFAALEWLRENSTGSDGVYYDRREAELPNRIANLLITADARLDERDELPCTQSARGQLTNLLAAYFKASGRAHGVRLDNRRERMSMAFQHAFLRAGAPENVSLHGSVRRLMQGILVAAFNALPIERQLQFLAGSAA